MNTLPTLIINRIRQIYKSEDVTQKELAERFQVSTSVVHNIIHNRTHKDPYYQPVLNGVPVDVDYLRKVRKEHNLSFAALSEIEKQRSGRAVSFSGEHIRKLIRGERGKKKF